MDQVHQTEQKLGNTHLPPERGKLHFSLPSELTVGFALRLCPRGIDHRGAEPEFWPQQRGFLCSMNFYLLKVKRRQKVHGIN